MAAPLPALTITTNELIRLFRAWGWQFVSEGVKTARFKKDRATITIKRAKLAPAEPANEAAIHDGVDLETWLQGPPPDPTPKSSLDQEDIDWFLRTKMETITDVEEKSRYRRIRRILSEEGTLKQYMKIADKVQVTANFQQGPDNPATKIEPLPVQADQEGYISLEEALALRNLKPNGLSVLACQFITVLAINEPFADEDGGTTRKVAEQMPAFTKPHRGNEPVGLTAISTQVKLWEEAGLVWREKKGKRTYKIGLSMPVKVTPEEIERYTLVEGPSPVTREPIEVPTPPAESLVEDSAEAGEVEGDSTRPPFPAVSLVGPHEDPAIECLQDKIKWHLEQIDKLQYAVDVLQEDQS